MLDLSRIADVVTEVADTAFRGAAGEDRLPLDVLQDTEFDFGALDGLNPDEIINLLSEHEIDVSHFASGELQDLFGSPDFDLENSITDMDAQH